MPQKGGKCFFAAIWAELFGGWFCVGLASGGPALEDGFLGHSFSEGWPLRCFIRNGTHILLSWEFLAHCDIWCSHVTRPTDQPFPVFLVAPALQGLLIGVKIIELQPRWRGRGKRKRMRGRRANDEAATCLHVIVGFPSELWSEVVFTHLRL